jgi:hypothetical protein
MKISKIYSHLNGEEWLMVRRKGLYTEIKDVIEAIDATKCRTKISKEKTMRGRKLYSPTAINQEFKARFSKLGWNHATTSYYVTDEETAIRKSLNLRIEDQQKMITAEGRRPIRSYNQTDFVKEEVAVEVQLGKYAFIAYDLFVKHLAFYVGGQIKVGVEVLPMKAMQVEMSSGPGYFEGALYDIVRQGRGVPAVPLLLIGVEP